MKRRRLSKRTIITSATVIAVLAVLAGGFVGCGHRGYYAAHQDPERRVEWLSDKITDRLDLTDDQKAKVDALLPEFQDRRQKGREWRQTARQDIVNLVRQEQIGQADINALVETHRQHMDELVSFASDRIIEFHALLTPEQREKLATEIENHQHGHGRFCRFKKW